MKKRNVGAKKDGKKRISIGFAPKKKKKKTTRYAEWQKKKGGRPDFDGVFPHIVLKKTRGSPSGGGKSGHPLFHRAKKRKKGVPQPIQWRERKKSLV